ncbi:MAG: hypothetical protein HY850_01215 [Betaproteobacteria bacterium]|nr:hypothetical protein [Betaproteobacteria bacterium]
MKNIILFSAGLFFFHAYALAGETLNADAVKKLITGNTAHTQRGNGAVLKNYFAPDGKIIRHENGETSEGTWMVKDDGMHCVEGIAGGCASIVKNGDGSYDRVRSNGKVAVTWTTVVNGKDF